MKKIYIALILVNLSGVTLLSQTVEIEVRTTIDNTIFKGLPLSNGVGEYLFTGTTDKDVKKRALVMFDLSSAVPEGVSIDSARIVMVPSKVKPGNTTVTVYRLTSEWGEGTSKATDGDGKGAAATTNDATWDYAKFSSVPWIKPGGDYHFESSTTSTVSLGNDAIFSSESITADVTFWLANPSKNYGWIFIGDESTTATSVKFVSKDHDDPAMRPSLRLYYQGSTSIDKTAQTESGLTVFQGRGMDNIIVSNGGDRGSCTMDLYSITGTKVYSNQLVLSNGKNTISTGIQEPGIYIYHINFNGISASGKFMITVR